jgi:hypothetical protein
MSEAAAEAVKEEEEKKKKKKRRAETSATVRSRMDTLRDGAGTENVCGSVHLHGEAPHEGIPAFLPPRHGLAPDALEDTVKIGTSRTRRILSVGAAGLLMAALAACTGRGGGTLPPDSPMFNAQAQFGFDFSCQDSGGINPQPGKLQIQLDYTDQGTNPLGGPFAVHGIVDQIDPVLESEVCSGQQPSNPPGHLTFLGRYWPKTSPGPGQLSTCPAGDTSTTKLCRFEVTVEDNDRNLAPSSGDFFSIQLSTATCDIATLEDAANCSTLPSGSVVYTRAGLLQGGNITVN